MGCRRADCSLYFAARSRGLEYHPLAVSASGRNREVAKPKGFFMRTAFLIDGGFFLRRYHRLAGPKSPRDVARALHKTCLDHLQVSSKNEPGGARLYRIFYYDCPPLLKKCHHPITGAILDFAKSPLAVWRLAFFEELKKLRKVAIRYGYLNDRGSHWAIKPEPTKELLAGKTTLAQLTSDDLRYEVRQKGVDMRLGLDIASLAFKKQVGQIILVAGDSDFVPAAKLARREGIDFILDPMWAPIRDDLHEHIDGLRTVIPRQGAGTKATATETT